MEKPFLCDKCKNWYVPIERAVDDVCVECVNKSHGDKSHCHFNDSSAMPSEVALARAYYACIEARDRAKVAIKAVKQGDDLRLCRQLQEQAHIGLQDAEALGSTVQEALRWAGVFEMPGRQGDDPEARYKDIGALTTLVNTNRRPPEDLAQTRRSLAVCQALAAEIPEELRKAQASYGEATEALAKAKQKAETKKESVPA